MSKNVCAGSRIRTCVAHRALDLQSSAIDRSAIPAIFLHYGVPSVLWRIDRQLVSTLHGFPGNVVFSASFSIYEKYLKIILAILLGVRIGLVPSGDSQPSGTTIFALVKTGVFHLNPFDFPALFNNEIVASLIANGKTNLIATTQIVGNGLANGNIAPLLGVHQK